MDPPPLLDAFDRAGYRMTGPRRAVAELIAGREGHFTAADIEADARLHRPGIGRATIFRALEVLLALGVVERIDLPSGGHAYVTCEPQHHHHVVCTACGRATDIDDAGLRAVVDDIGGRTGYRIERHRLELFGVCPTCQAAGAAGAAG